MRKWVVVVWSLLWRTNAKCPSIAGMCGGKADLVGAPLAPCLSPAKDRKGEEKKKKRAKELGLLVVALEVT